MQHTITERRKIYNCKKEIGQHQGRSQDFIFGGGTEAESRRRENREVWGLGRGCPLPNRLGDLGERVLKFRNFFDNTISQGATCIGLF